MDGCSSLLTSSDSLYCCVEVMTSISEQKTCISQSRSLSTQSHSKSNDALQNRRMGEGRMAQCCTVGAEVDCARAWNLCEAVCGELCCIEPDFCTTLVCIHVIIIMCFPRLCEAKLEHLCPTTKFAKSTVRSLPALASPPSAQSTSRHAEDLPDEFGIARSCFGERTDSNVVFRLAQFGFNAAGAGHTRRETSSRVDPRLARFVSSTP